MTAKPELPEADGRVADAVEGNWVDRWAPVKFRPFLRLSRADRPIGTWLLLLPCWWGALMAAAETEVSLVDLAWVLVACALGAWVMRGAGCTWNDITDRKIDAAVERTRSRPIPSGQVTLTGAVVWMIVQCLLGLAVLLTFNSLAVALGIASLSLVAIYPFAKRFTWWPQAFLGLAFNWGVLVAYAAIAEKISASAILLYLAGIAWTLFYDTIYAHQDKEDDALIGVKSTARLFGENTHRWLRRFMVTSVVLMGAAVILGHGAGANPLALVLALGGPWAMGWHLAWQNRRLDIDDGALCNKLFHSNRDAGLLAVLFLAAALLV